MQVRCPIRESDIGRVRTGMPAQFTVAAYPGEVFRAKVVQIRLKAAAREGSVVYTVVAAVDNSGGKLLPYLTADLRFETGRRHDVLRAPNTALNWRPRREQLPPDLRETLRWTLAGREEEGPPSAGRRTGETAPGGTARSRGEGACLWLTDGRFVRPVEVQIGASDGALTEVSGGNVTEGLEVVVGEESTAAENSPPAETSDADGGRPDCLAKSPRAVRRDFYRRG